MTTFGLPSVFCPYEFQAIGTLEPHWSRDTHRGVDASAATSLVAKLHQSVIMRAVFGNVITQRVSGMSWLMVQMCWDATPVLMKNRVLQGPALSFNPLLDFRSSEPNHSVDICIYIYLETYRHTIGRKSLPHCVFAIMAQSLSLQWGRRNAHPGPREDQQPIANHSREFT